MRRGNDDWEFRFENFDDWDLSAFKFWAAGEEGNYLLKEFRSARHAEALKLIDFAVHLLSMIR